MNILDSFGTLVNFTESVKKMEFDGEVKPYPVYKIKLEALYYNDQNDRIATWISKYKADKNIEKIDTSDLETYNNIIHPFIVDSNPNAFKKTKNNIRITGQNEPGVVLRDGRIIDGNRRFTCLRELAKEEDKFGYFEAVILDKDIEENFKEIKKLELRIQLGKDEKVDYNPIDKLVGIYNDVIENKVLTAEEYAKCVDISAGEMQKKLDQAQLMVEFLEFIGAPKKFHIARDLELDGPLIELTSILKKCKTDEAREDVKNCVFTNMLMKPKGDITRFIRPLKEVVASEYLDDFLEEQLPIAEAVLEMIPTDGMVNEKYINDNIRSNEDIKERLQLTMEKSVGKVRRSETKMRPLQLIEKCIVNAEGVDLAILPKAKNNRELVERITYLEDILAQIKEKALKVIDEE